MDALSRLVADVTAAVDALEQHLRYDPMDYLDFQQEGDVRHALRRLGRIADEDIDR